MLQISYTFEINNDNNVVYNLIHFIILYYDCKIIRGDYLGKGSLFDFFYCII